MTRRLIQLRGLFADLGECHDIQSAIVTAIAFYQKIYPGSAVLAVLVADGELRSWRYLMMQNPDGPAVAGAVALDQIPAETDMLEIVNGLGRDVTPLVCERGAPRRALVDEMKPLLIDATKPQGTLLPDLQEIMGWPFATIMGSSHLRPLNRGRIVIMLAWTEPRPIDDDDLRFYQIASEIIARLAGFLSMYNWMVRLERVNQSIRRNIVHDLKTPISVIKGYADTLELIADDPDPALIREIVPAIGEQADRLLEDLKEILSPPLETDWSPSYEAFDLAQLVHRTVMGEQYTERARDHQFQVEGADCPLTVQADQRKMRRVLENLLSNAVKYSPGDGTDANGKNKTVHITLAVRDGQVTVSFRDEGIGMTTAQLQRIFDGPGRAVDTGLGIEGSGFGLDSCRQVLLAHGGAVWAESAPGTGSTFTLTLPLRPPPEPCGS